MKKPPGQRWGELGVTAVMGLLLFAVRRYVLQAGMAGKQRCRAAGNAHCLHILGQIIGIRTTQTTQGIDHRASVPHQLGRAGIGSVFALARK